MASQAGTYSVLQDFGYGSDETDRADLDPFWVVSVVRLGMPLSFSRQKMASITKDLTSGAMLRADKPLVITDDITQISIGGSKKSSKKSCSFSIKQTKVNYLVEMLPGDWVFVWLMNGREDFERIIQCIDQNKPCNDFKSGLKFVGRLDSVRKSIDVDPNGGAKTSGYSVSCVGFEELETCFFYDNALASRDALEKDLGQWLVRLGLDVTALFRDDATHGVKQNNINVLIPTLLDLIVGKGPSKKAVIQVEGPTTADNPLSATPTINEAPFSYMVPAAAASILGKKAGDTNKAVLGYSDILELMTGVQQYTAKSNDYKAFIPDLSVSNQNRRVCTQAMLGTFLPFFPEFTNKPLWQVFQQFLNPTLNEMYTCMRVTPEGNIMPTMILRQIPFTTEAFPKQESDAADDAQKDWLTSAFGAPPRDPPVAATRFLSLPRWEIDPILIHHLDVGRSNATRTNFVHIFGANAYQVNNAPIQYQMVVNPPIRDDIDIMRSGMRPYMATVNCWVGDQVGKTAGSWMRLVADWTIGSHLTLNGSVTVVGIQAPICEGDNVTLGDDCVYHIESVAHHASISPGSGAKVWTTTLTLTNGMRDATDDVTDNENSASLTGATPIYPGFKMSDNKTFDPGLTLEERPTTGGVSHRTPRFLATEDPVDDTSTSQLAPSAQTDQAPVTKRPLHKKRK